MSAHLCCLGAKFMKAFRSWLELSNIEMGSVVIGNLFLIL